MLQNLQKSLARCSRSFCSKVTSQSNPNQSTAFVRPRVYGQPTAYSHPHVLKPGELTPGITVEEFQRRRLKLMQNLVSASLKRFKADRVITVIPSATKVFMSEKIPYPFRQNSDFLYLTGFMEPDSLLLLTSSGNDASQYKSVIFVPKYDARTELWDGPRTRPDDAVSLLGIDEAYATEELDGILNSYLLKNTNGTPLVFWCDFATIAQTPEFERQIKTYISNYSPNFVESPRSLIHQLRVIKSPAEIQLMAHSGEIASDAFVEAIGATKVNVTEHTLYAKIEYECRVKGAERLAYPPVIAGGCRATTIHYVANDQMLREGELLLVDAGCEYHGYASDITRTWPVNNTFSSLQKELYEALLDVQQKLITKCKDCLSLDQLYAKMIDLLGVNFQQVGLLSKSLNCSDKSKMISKYCPHHVGHYLGMDVHDTPSVSRSIPLKPGMIITVEPGIYISLSDNAAPKELRGIGMRIEDNVLITENEPVVLSAKCPKTIDQIERIRLTPI
ncbi:hypothetical protein CHUAL_001548 [Chamberlinius hualienensis]